MAEDKTNDAERVSKPRRRSSVGGIPLPPQGSQIRKTRKSVYMPAGMKVAEGTGDGGIDGMKRRASMKGAAEGSEGIGVKKRSAPKRVSLAATFTHAHLKDVAISVRVIDDRNLGSITEGGKGNEDDNFL
mmetsp:Transcript_24387/g.50674  ORF Transcript_24387/g.50674 Transcript_24387/m.50674 type:complete len:130 (-) Transcript_24387:340-729(-)